LQLSKPTTLRQAIARAALSPAGGAAQPVGKARRRPSIAGYPEAALARWFRTAGSHAVVPGELDDLRESRARIQAAADAERRRIERNLHDGAQQRLMAIKVHLTLAAERVENADPPTADDLRTLATEIDDALDDIRSLAVGLYPPALKYGLVHALRSLAIRSPLPTTVHAVGVQRYSREIEEAAYFCAVEAIQNATKYAADATAVSVDLSHAGTLDFEVRDNGAGFDPASVTTGHGLLNMRDRLNAVGGHLTIRSRPGDGTQVIASIPLP
jgi:signal transduction histidine kinase